MNAAPDPLAEGITISDPAGFSDGGVHSCQYQDDPKPGYGSLEIVLA